MCDDRQSVNISELLPLDSGSVHQAALWEEWLCAPRIGWQKDIFQMTRVAHAPKWMTCFISNDRLTAFTAHLLLAAPPPTLFSGSEASVIKRGGGNRRCRFSLGLREAERNACFCRSKPRLVFDQRAASWGFSALSASDFLQTAQSLVRQGCWWAGFPTFRLSVGRFITHKTQQQHQSSYLTPGK